MSFVRKRKLYPLDFTGTGLEGLTMVMKGMTVRESLQLSRLRDLGDASTAEQEKELLDLFAFVAEKIHEWDMVEEGGTPIEPTAEALLELDAGDAFAAIEAWQKAVEGVSAPLDQRSNGGNGSGTSDQSLPPLPMPS
jgi:hypothetical protein